VVEDKKSSATLSYVEGGSKQSIVIVEKERNEILNNNPNKSQYPSVEVEYKKYIQLQKTATNEQIKKTNERIKYLKSVKVKNDILLKKKIEKKKELKRKRKLALQRQSMPSRGTTTHHESIVFEGSAYTPFCSEGCSGVTRTGYDVSNTVRYKGMRIIATDPRIIPLYSIVKISYGDSEFYAISLDTGGAIKGYRIDYLVGSESEAIQFGRRKIMVEVIKYGQRK
jgi:3D (Asp-Asp-Asp) domain-containing protein